MSLRARLARMNTKYCRLPLVFYALILVISLSFSAKFCDRNPHLIQCVALKNQDVRPQNENCSPLKQGSCKTGDLVSPKIAKCARKYSGNTQNSLVSGFKTGLSIRCFPALRSPKSKHLRNVAPSYGEPQCVPVPGMSIVCGEHGTRCVCDAPGVAEFNPIGWLENKCRCQFFVNLCQISAICQHERARCRVWGSELKCECPPDIPDCVPGINQCQGNPGLCEDEGKLCIELDDRKKGWIMGSEVEGKGYTCMSKKTAEILRVTTHYCYVPAGKDIERVEKIQPRDDLDMCCYRMMTCAGGNTTHGTIFSYRPCYCFVEFRKCLLQLFSVAYKATVQAIVKVVDSITFCEMDDGVKCHPSRPWTCRKGDLISSSIAHCKINCKSGPLLPIWERACSKRQCKPPHYQKHLLIADVPRNEESSLCKPVKGLPVECAKRGTHTRCVCEANPKVSGFTDRCRCQFWPSRWNKFLTTTPSRRVNATKKPSI